MKLKRMFKKAAAMLLAVVTALSVIPIQSVFAATGDVGTITFSYTYDSDGNPMRYNSGAVIDGYTAGGEGKYKYRMFVDGDTAFCLQPGVPLHTGDTLTEASSEAWNSLSYAQQRAIGLALLYGYQGNRGNLSSSDDEKWVATQTLVWEFVTGCREATSPYTQVSQTAYSLHFGSSYPNSGARAVYDEIVALLTEHNTIPSFMSESMGGVTKSLNYADGKYTLTLTDNNGVLSDYSFSSSNASVKVTKSGNQLTITSEQAFEGTVRISATRNNVPTVSESAKLIAYGSDSLQDVVTGAENASPVNAYLNVETPVGTLNLKKTSEDGVVGGIQFTITGKNFNQTVTTQADGTITVEGMFPGTYTVTEAGYDRYEPQNSQTVTIVGGKTATVTFNNTLKRGQLEVKKTSEDGLVEGVTFHLYGTSLSGLAVDEYAVTDASGVARFENVLISGSEPYVIEEMDTAIRYVVPDDQTAAIEWNKVTQRSFENVLKKFRVEVVKTDAETGYSQGDASLAGAVYGLYQGDTLMATYTTDTNGAFTTDYFICNSNWTLKEISPSEGYLLDETVYKIPAEPGNFTVELNTVSSDVTEQVIKGRIRIVKHIDVELDVEETAEAPAEETIVPVTAEESQPVSGNDLAELSAETAGSADAQTEVEDTAGVQTESEDAGALPEESAVSDEAALDDEAMVTESEEAAVEAGSETEDAAPETTDGTESEAETEETPSETEAEATQEPEAEIPEEYQPVEIPVEDLEASGGSGIIEQPEEGAKFQIYLTSAGSYDNAREAERDILVTDADGFAVSKDLPYGRYTVHQIEGKEGQAFVKDFTVFIRSEDETYSYIINNQTQSSLIRVEKHDIETGKIIPAANIGFQVRDLSTGELITQTVYYPTPVEITTFFTNDEGWLMLPCELPYGSYELIEVETCYGYVLDSIPVPFTVDGSQDVVVVEKHNIAQKGRIHITKTGETLSTVLVEENKGFSDIYTPVCEIGGMEGAVYEIRAAENIYTLDGTLRAEKGTVVDTVTTDADGQASSGLLYLGKYEIVEIQAPDGMVLNTESKTVELTYAGQEVDVTETSADFYNERQKVQISLAKVMEQDEKFGIGMNGEVHSVIFGLYAAEDIVAADGTMIPADGLIEVIEVQEDGTAVTQTDLPFGSYYLREDGTDAHYLANDKKYPVVFAYAGQETALVEIQANDGEAIENKLKYGSISGKKLDEDGNALADAKIGLFSAKTEEFTEENAILVTTSAEDGSFSFEKVPYGTWIVREIEQPEGFVLCEESFPVEITKDAQAVTVEITNKFITGSIHLTKYDADYPDHKLTGATFEVYRDSNGDQKLDKNDELLGTLEEVDPGEYEMTGLRYGGYLVRETVAPEGFYLDDGVYYVSVDTDGKIYEVENEAGKGFINQAQRGNLKIIKTSSDGVVEGFSFHIVGDDYDETFKTDSNGQIYIEGLRVGKYTITEVEDSLSAGYKRPAPVEVELVVDETLTVNVHNDKVTVDVPKTGDDNNLVLWLAILGVSLVGVGGTVYFSRKNKKRDGKFLVPRKKKR